MSDAARNIETVVLRHAPVAIAAVSGDPQFRFLYANEAFIASLALTGDPTGRQLTEAIPGIEDALLELLRRILQERTPVGVRETDVPDVSTTARPKLWSADYVPVLDDDGAVHSIVITCLDPKSRIKAHHREEQAAAEAEHEGRLRTSLGITPVTVVHRDRDMRVTWVYNPLISNPVRRLVGRTPEETYRPESAASLRAFYQPVLERGQSVHSLIELSSASANVTRLYDMFAQPLRDQDGEVCGISCAAYDVTRLVETHRVLEAREAQLRLALDAADMAEWEYDIKSGKIIHSSSFSRLYGMPLQQGPSSPEVFAARLASGCRETIKSRFVDAIVAGQKNVNKQYRITWPNGTERWIASRGQVQYENGQPVRIIGIEMDITEERRTLELLERTNAELEQFAYAASHDLKEPMRTISSFATLLERHLEDALDERARGYIDFIRRGTQRMERLINGLLEYARTSHIGQEQEEVHLEEVLLEVVQQLDSMIISSGSEISNDPLPLVRGDRLMLSSVLQNLLSNAMKFRRGEAPAKIHLSAGRRGQQWLIKVADNGPGIESAIRQKVFEPFHRLSRDENRPGAGLGLALCKKIIERHGGRIWVETNPSGGSVFLFTLPASEATTT
ncbi:MAG TPA: ATP-binding protein [Gammaproteobacteria bacterium]|nr:ATP-binding protein [Gammaproteobacteria bacterium]